MIDLYFFAESQRERVLAALLKDICGRECKIARTQNGKPYISGDPVCFSLSHSGGTCAIAISQEPVGVDTEIICKKKRMAVISSFGEEERKEINCERDFLKHWTAREAFVKLKGGRIWEYLKRLQFIGGQLFFDGKATKEQIAFHLTENAVTAICSKRADFMIKDYTVI